VGYITYPTIISLYSRIMIKPNKKVYFGAAVLLAVLLVAGVAAGRSFMRDPDPYTTQAPPPLPQPPLKTLAKQHNLQIGSFAARKYLRERPYADILSSQFEYAIVDGEPNWHFEDSTLRPAPDKYDFTSLDKVFGFAEQHAMPIRYQHLLWGDAKWLPDWLTQGKYSREQLLDLIHNHIETVGARYKGRVREYSVVNEAFSRKLLTGGNHDWWGEQLGTDYIDQSFTGARQADPGAVLILNDFGNETEGQISNLMYDYVKDARARGIPVDAIGMQMHISGTNPPAKDKVLTNMQRFAALGVKVYVTEFDVNMHGVIGDDLTKQARQAEIYRDMLGACLEAGPDVCPNFGFLGLVDRQSWYNGLGIHDASPLMFHDDYSPKPAFFAVRELLSKK
jgi:endo-1,4-beta-xylanase